MKMLIPNMYARTILNINYKLLKNMNITNLMFDLDDTIVPSGIYDKIENRKNVIQLFESLNQLFYIIIVTRARPINYNKNDEHCSKGIFEIIQKQLGIKYMYLNVHKYTLSEWKKIIEKNQFNPQSTAMIGNYPDDIVIPNYLGVHTIMVTNAPSKKDIMKVKTKILK